MAKDVKKAKYASPEGSQKWEYLCAFFCAISTACTGSVLGWNSPTLTEFEAANSPFSLSVREVSTLSAAPSFGNAVSPIFCVLTINRIGRRNSLLLSMIPMTVSWGLILIAEDVRVLIAARIIAGFASGVIFYTIPIYKGEILSSHLRGPLSSVGSITYNIGNVFMFAVGPHLGFRITAGVCMAVGICLLISFWVIPKSPYFLMMVGKEDQAEGALEKLRGKPDVSDELEQIKTTLREKGKTLVKSEKTRSEVHPKKWSDALVRLFTIRGNIRAFFIIVIFSLMLQFSGLGKIITYGHIIFKDMGSPVEPATSTTIFAVLQLVCNVLGFGTVTRFGRRQLVLISGVLSGICLMIIAIYFYLIEHTNIDVKRFAIIPFCTVFIFILVLTTGFNVAYGVIITEIFATDIKALALCIITIFSSTIGMISIKYYLLMVKSWGFGHSVPFFIFMISMWLGTALLSRLLPETKGKTLLEIQRKLND